MNDPYDRRKPSTILVEARERAKRFDNGSYYVALHGDSTFGKELYETLCDYLRAAVEDDAPPQRAPLPELLAAYDRAISMALSDEARS